MSAWHLWCHDVFCDVNVWSVVPWYILWHQDMWDDYVMSRHVLWCCVSLCDSCDWKGTGGKTQTNRSWNGAASEPAVPTCPTGNALMPTALSWGVNSIYLLWNCGHFPPHHPPWPPSHHSISVHHAPPPVHLLDKNNWKKEEKKHYEHGTSSSRLLNLYTNISVNLKKKKLQSRSDLVMVLCVSVIKINSEVKLLRSTVAQSLFCTRVCGDNRYWCTKRGGGGELKAWFCITKLRYNHARC